MILAGVQAAPSAGQTSNDRIADVMGAGSVGSWETVFDFANPEPVQRTVAIHFYRLVFTPVCNCIEIVIPAHGTASYSTGAFGFETLRVEASDGLPLPSVSVRWVNRQNTAQTFSVPLLRRSTLMALNPQVLVFPAARDTPAGARANLVLGHLSFDVPVTVRVEALGTEGKLLGSREVGLGGIGQPLVVRVADLLGVNSLLDASVRVTLTGGAGPLWGYLVIVDEAGGVRAVTGTVP